MANRKTIHARDQEWASFSTSAEQVGRHDWLPDIPLTVITRGKRVWPHNNFGDESEKVWSLLQSDLTDLTDDAIQVIAGNSGHLVHLDEPEFLSQIRARLQTVKNLNWSAFLAEKSNH